MKATESRMLLAFLVCVLSTKFKGLFLQR